MENEFFTVSEAAKELKLTEYNVMSLVAQERLQICFKYTGEIVVMGMTTPQGEEPDRPKTIRFRGVLKLMQPPTDDEHIEEWAALASVLRADGIFMRSGERYRLPTEHDHGGYLKAGHQVVGFVEDVEVPRAEWTFHIDDLTRLNQGIKEAPVSGEKWTPERLAELKTYREKHGTSKAAKQYGITAARIRKLLPREKPTPKGVSAFSYR